MEENVKPSMKDSIRDYYGRQKKEWYKFPLTFWDVVEKINWRGKNGNLPMSNEDFQKGLLNGNQYILDSLDITRKAYADVLKTAVFDYDMKTNGDRCSGKIRIGGDDSFDDLVNHIIGCGKEVYFDVLNNPGKITEYKDECRESFAYMFHELR